MSAQPLQDFNVGEIPPQTVWHGQSVQFSVRSDALGTQAMLSVTSSPPPLGNLTFNAGTRIFSYTPDLRDKREFTVKFLARLGTNLVSQDVEVAPMAHLPSEFRVFGISPGAPPPDPESTDYILRSEIRSESPETFNNQMRTTRRIVISAKRAVFQQGHANGLYDYNDNDDIVSFEVHAETVIVRSSLRLPQTAVSIFARELRFEDLPGSSNRASIVTTPRSLTVRPAQFQNGSPGLTAGDAMVTIQSFHADFAAGPRFVLVGGNGQPAGLGQLGGNGADMTAYDGTEAGVAGLFNVPACPWGRSLTYFHFTARGLTLEFSGSLGDPNNWPGDGLDATAGGKPGNGGSGGNLRATISDLSSSSSFAGGTTGTAADLAAGGRGGSPNPAYRANYHWSSGWSQTAQHSSAAGRDAAAPPADIPVGSSGQFSLISRTNGWLTPNLLRMVLRYAKDTYFYGHLDLPREVCVDYIALIDAYSQSMEWASVSEASRTEMLQISDEMQSILHRIDSNLDFWGNPPGWVPMLSFEVNKAVYEIEIDRGIRALYLAYWVRNTAASLQEKIDAMAAARDRLNNEIDEFQDRHDAASLALPALQAEAAYITNQVHYLQTRLEELEQELLRRAEQIVSERHKVPSWQTFLRRAGAILPLLPFSGEVLGPLGAGLNIIGSLDFRDPISTVGNISDAVKQFRQVDFNALVTSWRNQLDPIQQDCLRNSDIIECIKRLRSFGQPIVGSIRSIQAELKKTEVLQPEVEAELQRMKAVHPEFTQVVDEIAEFTARKEVFARQLAATVQELARLSDGITHDFLAIDGLNRDISQGNAAVDHRVLYYLQEMEHRARERLLKYHYYLAKSYEYRTSLPFTGELNLTGLFDRFRQLIETGTGRDLTGSEFDSLKALYEEQLSTIVQNIFDYYNSNRPEVVTPVRFNLSSNELATLNAGLPVRLDLVSKGLVPMSHENVRFVDVRMTNVVGHVEDGSLGLFAFSDLSLEHSGVSHLTRQGQNFAFRHYNANTVNPFIWAARYDAIDRRTDLVGPSPDTASLLFSLMSDRGISTSSDNLLLYARPGVWADLVLTKQDESDTGVHIVIDSLRIEVIYEFTRQRTDQARLEVGIVDATLQPYVQVSAMDLNARQDARGGFVRTYPKGVHVNLEAPASYGEWVFEKWTDRFGVPLSVGVLTNRVLALTMTNNASVRAQYKLTANDDTDQDGLPDQWEQTYFGSLTPDAAGDFDRDGLSNLREFQLGTNPASRDTDGDGSSDSAELLAGTDALDSHSVLKFRPVVRNQIGRLVLAWPSVPGKFYQLQAADSMQLGSWSDFGGELEGTGNELSTLVNPIGNRRFFRIVVR